MMLTLAAMGLLMALPAMGDRTLLVHTYAQCGGAGGSCKGADCKDAAWPDFACLSYAVCTRISQYHWQCNLKAPTPAPKPHAKPHTPAPTKKPHAPAPTKPHAPVAVQHVHTYAQCGGEGGSCKGANCKDAAWTGFACLSTGVCTRINHWWWQCNLKPKVPTKPTTPRPTAPVKPFSVAKYKQCGGAGGFCKGAQCRDGVWPGATCPSGFKCYRVSQYHWQCDTHTLDG